MISGRQYTRGCKSERHMGKDYAPKKTIVLTLNSYFALHEHTLIMKNPQINPYDAALKLKASMNRWWDGGFSGKK